MGLVLPVKYHELYTQKSLKDLPKEHGNFHHYLVGWGGAKWASFSTYLKNC